MEQREVEVWKRSKEDSPPIRFNSRILIFLLPVTFFSDNKDFVAEQNGQVDLENTAMWETNNQCSAVSCTNQCYLLLSHHAHTWNNSVQNTLAYAAPAASISRTTEVETIEAEISILPTG